MCGQSKGQIGPTQWSELDDNLVPCPTTNHTGYNPKVHYGSKNMHGNARNFSL